MKLISMTGSHTRQIAMLGGVGVLCLVFGVAMGAGVNPSSLFTESGLASLPWGLMFSAGALALGGFGFYFSKKALEHTEKTSQEIDYTLQRLVGIEKRQSDQHTALQSTIQTSLHHFLAQSGHEALTPAMWEEIKNRIHSYMDESLRHALKESSDELSSEMGIVGSLVKDLTETVGLHEQNLAVLRQGFSTLTERQRELQKETPPSALATLSLPEVQHLHPVERALQAEPVQHNPYAPPVVVHPVVMDDVSHMPVLQQPVLQQPVLQQPVLQQPVLQNERDVQQALPAPAPLSASLLLEPSSPIPSSLEELVKAQVAQLFASVNATPHVKQDVQTSRTVVADVSPSLKYDAPHHNDVEPSSKPTPHKPTTQIELLAREALQAAQRLQTSQHASQNALSASLSDSVVSIAANPAPQSVFQNLAPIVQSISPQSPHITPQMLEKALERTIDHMQSGQLSTEKASIEKELALIEERGFVQNKNVAASDVAKPSHQRTPKDEMPAQATPLGAIPETAQREAIANALREDKIELHLQPIMFLPQRKAHFYETLSRLRISPEELLTPAHFLPVVEELGQSAIFDARMATRAIEIARHLQGKGSEALVSLNVAAETLADEGYLKTLDRLIAENGTLRDRLVLEIGQGTIRTLGAGRLVALKALSHRGIKLCIDRVNDARIDAQTLAQIGISYVKLPASLLMGSKANRFDIAPADLALLFKRNGIQLIAEHVETEDQVRELLDLDIPLAQGHAFAAPKPVRSDVFGTGSSVKGISKAPSAKTTPDTALSAQERQSLRTFLSRSAT
jgi:EAL domain-containing protein (putative c-di-GMP-specific phosphodiesterase class I)